MVASSSSSSAGWKSLCAICRAGWIREGPGARLQAQALGVKKKIGQLLAGGAGKLSLIHI
eukprot:1048387-Pyramimonas_sp.AAC.1